MQETNTSTTTLTTVGASDILSEILREGAQEMLAAAIQAEVQEWIDRHAHLVDAKGRRQVVRNGSMPERSIVTGVGEIQVQHSRPSGTAIAKRKGTDRVSHA